MRVNLADTYKERTQISHLKRPSILSVAFILDAVRVRRAEGRGWLAFKSGRDEMRWKLLGSTSEGQCKSSTRRWTGFPLWKKKERRKETRYVFSGHEARTMAENKTKANINERVKSMRTGIAYSARQWSVRLCWRMSTQIGRLIIARSLFQSDERSE